MRFIPGLQSSLNIWKSVNTIHHISKKNPCFYLNTCRGCIWGKNSLHLGLKFSETRNRREHSQLDKGHLQKLTAKHHTSWWKTECFPLEVEEKVGMSTLTSSLQYRSGDPIQCNKRGKRNQRHRVGKTV